MPQDVVEQPAAMSRKPDFHLPITDCQTGLATFSDSLRSPRSAHGHHKQHSGHDGSSNDRVFPIRSVVSVDATQTPLLGPQPATNEYNTFPGFGISGSADRAPNRDRNQPRFTSNGAENHRVESKGEQRLETGITSDNHQKNGRQADNARLSGGLRLFNEASPQASEAATTTAGEADSVSGKDAQANDFASDDAYVTSRFKHIVTEHGHAIVTGRDGTTLQRCEDEPIHIPGAVQSFGLLVALSEESDGALLVRVVSENSKNIIGFSPEQLFRLGSFTDILTDEQSDNLLDHLDFIRDEDADPATNGPDVFTISIKPPKGRTVKLWCGMHINPSSPDLIICEFELDDDQANPLAAPNQDSIELADTLDSQPTQEEFEESTANLSKPLRVLRSARKRKGEAAAMEVFNIMSQIQEQLANAATLDLFLKILVGVVKELTGFHRVMIYQFDSTFNGRVVTELVDPRATKDLYKGLNFPASDIPKQARDLYKLSKVRLLYDRDLETARLVCRTLEDLETPLDLTFSYLRAMSPIHIKYLANMAVRSSMSISINAFGELWGLIACHGYGAHGMRVSFPIRKMCRLIGDTASRNIERLSYASRLQARKLINTVPTEANPSGYIIASSEDLLKLFDADFGLLSIKSETKVIGKLEQTQEALVMLEYLRLRSISSVITTQDVKQDFPDLRYGPGFQIIAGFLLVPLSTAGSDFIVFFRKRQTKEVKWAGNPYEKFVRAGTEGYLEPRKSFKTWSETVTGKCREWTEEQVETAAVLCLVYGKFIEVWRQKEAALQSSQLTRLLLSNQAHEVRTPLNAIINYLEIALEGSLDQETRENLAKSHSASKSLIYVINDLLDLTKTEESQNLVKNEIFDLPNTVREAAEQFEGDANRKNLQYSIVVDEDVPCSVHGDQRRLRQAVSNLIANAMKYTSSGSVKVELELAELSEHESIVEIGVEDTGCGMSNEQLDQLFEDLEQISVLESDVSSDTISDRRGSEPAGPRTLGLGLAVVARFVSNMEGQLRLKSEEGEGSRFVIQLRFALPSQSPASTDSGATITDSLRPSLASSGRASRKGADSYSAKDRGRELLLVDQSNTARGDAISRKRSIEDVASVKSALSQGSALSTHSKKSDVDRLIEAISEPFSPSDTRREGAVAQSRRSFDGVSRNTLNEAVRPSLPRHSSTGHREMRLAERTRRVGEGIAVTGEGTSLLAVRMPDELSEQQPSQTESQLVSPQSKDVTLEKQVTSDIGLPAGCLRVLVAEDDPINSKIIIKRLDKLGHKVTHTVNGEACASAFGTASRRSYDVVLMDMQMPIVDGLTATKMIRSEESLRGQPCDRVPIFAVSASLLERERQVYIDAGFDGWILKPIDFKRLKVLMDGIADTEVRKSCYYQPGRWEYGGWFQSPAAKQHVHKSQGRRPGSFSTSEGAARSQPRQDDSIDAVDVSNDSMFTSEKISKYTVEDPVSPFQT